MRKKGDLTEKLFDWCIKYKQAALRRGEKTPVMDRLIFKTVRSEGATQNRSKLERRGGVPKYEC